MNYGDSRYEDPAADAAMTTLYRQLSNQDLPGDPDFDVEDGLRELTGRIRRELEEHTPEPADADQAERLPAYAAAARSRLEAVPAGKEPKLTKHPKRGRARPDRVQLELARLEYAHEREMAAARSRTSTRFFAGIAAMAITTTAALISAAPHLTSTVVIAVAVINAVSAAASTLIHRGGELARRPGTAVHWHAQALGSEPPGGGNYTRPADAVTTGKRPGQLPAGPTRIHIENFHGTLTTADLADADPRDASSSARPHHRAVTAVLAVLTVAIAAAATVGIAGMIMQRQPLTGYEITLIAPVAISTLLLITSWWWRIIDASPPRPRRSAPASETTK